MADQTWIGAAADVKQVSTIAATGTWATDDTATLTINNQNLTVTIGSDVATSDVVAALAAAVNASSATANLVNDESRNFGGQEIPEFQDVVASSSGSTLTLESRVAGVPFTVTRSESTAGTGALGAVTEATAATGKNWVSNTANYSGGALPGTDDTLFLDDSSHADLLYGLDGLNDATWLVKRTNNRSNIGLAPINPRGYKEYRQQRLDLEPDATGSVTHELYVGEGQGRGRCRIDMGTNSPTAVTVVVGNAPARVDGDAPLEIVGGADNVDLRVNGGAVDIGVRVSTETQLSAIKVTDTADVRLGNYHKLKASTTLVQRGGKLYMEKPSVTALSWIFDIHAGEFYLGYNASAITVNIFGGTVFPIGSNTVTTINGYGGVLDLRLMAAGALTLSNDLEAFKGFRLFDPQGDIDEIDCNGCTIQEVLAESRQNRSYSATDL